MNYCLDEGGYDLIIIVDAPLVHYANIMIARDRKTSSIPILYLDTVSASKYSEPDRWLWYMDYRSKPEKVAAMVQYIFRETTEKQIEY